MSATFQSRSEDPLLIAPSLNQFGFQKKIRFLDSGGREGSERLERERRGTRATINLDLVCILLFRRLYKDIILTLFILQTYSLTWLSSNTGSFYIWVISPLGVLKNFIRNFLQKEYFYEQTRRKQEKLLKRRNMQKLTMTCNNRIDSEL